MKESRVDARQLLDGFNTVLVLVFIFLALGYQHYRTRPETCCHGHVTFRYGDVMVTSRHGDVFHDDVLSW